MALHVHVNCAVTLDGCLGGPGGSRLRISNEEDKARVHRLRAGCDAILVGVGTVLADDPKLTVKPELAGGAKAAPLRVVLDPLLRTPPAARVRDAAAPTLFLCAPDAPARDAMRVERVPRTDGGLALDACLERLAAQGVRRLLVEGGAHVLASFLASDLVDEFTLFVASWTLGPADAPRLTATPVDLRPRLALVEAAPLGDGLVARWKRT